MVAAATMAKGVAVAVAVVATPVYRKGKRETIFNFSSNLLLHVRSLLRTTWTAVSNLKF